MVFTKEKPIVWSYSFLSTYDRCARQAEAKYISKELPYVESPEAKFGNDVHSAMEHYLNSGVIPKDEQTYKWAKKFIDPIKLLPHIGAEKKLGVDRDWKPVEFFSKEVWGRGKVDYATVHNDQAFLLDYKTGKVWEDPLELYIQGALLHALYPNLTSIKGCYIWTKEERYGDVYDVFEALDRTREWIEETMQKVGQGLFYAKPNKLCGWCDLKSCKHWKART